MKRFGSSSVICSDKTGTLTQNKMHVIEIYGDKEFLFELGTMCTDCELTNTGKITGDPTEIAIVNKAMQNGIYKDKLYLNMQRINEIPFDSDRKLMTTIHKMGNKYRIITKGAVDVLLNRCEKIFINENTKTLSFEYRNSILDKNKNMAEKALRILGVAYKDVERLPRDINSENIENRSYFCTDLFGMMDPPREGVKEAIRTCKNAGIKTVMITGDHLLTAKAIAKDLGILNENTFAITGKELDKIPQNILEKDIMKYSVFARVSPEHKVRIVKAFRDIGKVVAMTGDRSK